MSRHLHRGIALLNLNRIKEAAREFTLASGSGTDRATSLALLAYTQIKDGQLKEAHVSLERALALDAAHLIARAATAVLAVVEDRTGDARLIAKSLVRDYPNNAWAFTQTAWIELQLNDFAGSRQMAEQALALQPEEEQPLLFLMIAAQEMEDGSAAESIARQLLTINPCLAEPYAVLAIRRLKEHRWNDAREMIREALRLDPLSTYVAAAEARIAVANNPCVRWLLAVCTRPNLLLSLIFLPFLVYWAFTRLDVISRFEPFGRLLNPICIIYLLMWTAMFKASCFETCLVYLRPRWRKLLVCHEDVRWTLQTGFLLLGSLSAFIAYVYVGGGALLGVAILCLLLRAFYGDSAHLPKDSSWRVPYPVLALIAIAGWFVIIHPPVAPSRLTWILAGAVVVVAYACTRLRRALRHSQTSPK